MLSIAIRRNSPAYPMFRKDVRTSIEKSDPDATAPPRLDSKGSRDASASSTTLRHRAAKATTARYLLRGTRE